MFKRGMPRTTEQQNLNNNIKSFWSFVGDMLNSDRGLPPRMFYNYVFVKYGMSAADLFALNFVCFQFTCEFDGYLSCVEIIFDSLLDQLTRLNVTVF